MTLDCNHAAQNNKLGDSYSHSFHYLLIFRLCLLLSSQVVVGEFTIPVDLPVKSIIESLSSCNSKHSPSQKLQLFYHRQQFERIKLVIVRLQKILRMYAITDSWGHHLLGLRVTWIYNYYYLLNCPPGVLGRSDWYLFYRYNRWKWFLWWYSHSQNTRLVGSL